MSIVLLGPESQREHVYFMAEAYRATAWVHFNHLLTSYSPASHWPKQVTQPSPISMGYGGCNLPMEMDRERMLFAKP